MFSSVNVSENAISEARNVSTTPLGFRYSFSDCKYCGYKPLYSGSRKVVAPGGMSATKIWLLFNRSTISLLNRPS